MTVTVAVIGAGRMGTAVARQLPKDTVKIIVDSHLAKARELAATVEGKASDDLAGVRAADLIAVVLPAPVVNDMISKLLDYAKKGAIIVNMATAAFPDPEIMKRREDVTVIDAKIIGHAMSLSQGEPGLVVVKTKDNEVFQLIKSQLPGFSGVVTGNADLVATINTIGSTEGIKAAVAVRKQLSALNIPEEWIRVTIRTVCAGTMKSYTENDLGHFARELVKKLENEEK